jgi:molecular chaperone HtpG
MLDNHEPIFGKNVIETLSAGMYDNPLFLFREYVQNAADSIDAAERNGILHKGLGQIEITIDEEKRLIAFEDNGTGIPADSVAKMLANIGDSQKDRKTDKGFRGIGRLGGLGYCKKVRFETSAMGENEASFLEWDAKKLHEILADKNDHISAGALIKRITRTWRQPCNDRKHYFRVSLIEVNPSNNDLLDVEEVRKYLSLVAPVPFDCSKFRFIRKIEDFIKTKNLPALNEYRINLNGDEVLKGYETPLKIEDTQSIEILDIECRLLQNSGKAIGWYWFGISKFEGVLPKKCFQRNIRLRKANIQIGEGDCLSKHPRLGRPLWQEDRGNNYYIGEIHTLDEELIPNSRRDYFNQDESCRRFEAALVDEFKGLGDIYRKASQLRNAKKDMEDAKKAQQAFHEKDRKTAFFDRGERNAALEKVRAAERRAEAARVKIEKITMIAEEAPSSSIAAKPLASIAAVYSSEIGQTAAQSFNPAPFPRQGYAKDNRKKGEVRILETVFAVLNEKLPPDEAQSIREEINRRVAKL